MSAERSGNAGIAKPRAQLRIHLLAFVLGQVLTTHVQLHLVVKRRNVQRLASFNSTTLHFAV